MKEVIKIEKNIRIINLNHISINQILLDNNNIIIIILLLLKLNMIISPKIYIAINSQYSYITIKINETGNVFSTYRDNIGSLSGSHDFDKPNEININGLNQSNITPYYNFNPTKILLN